MRGYLDIVPVRERGSYSIAVRRGSAAPSVSDPGVQRTGCATQDITRTVESIRAGIPLAAHALHCVEILA